MSARSHRRLARGYTAVEVLIAMTLFAIGAAGVISMQKVTVQGMEDARRADIALNIANEWIGRLQRDAMFWTEPNSEKPSSINIGNTKWLKNVGGACALFCNIPMPAAPADGVSPAFDAFGRDLPSGTTEAFYCAQYRLNWQQDPGPIPGGPFKLSSSLRAEVRVYWHLLEDGPIGDCGTPPPEFIPPGSPWHYVYAVSAIRENAKR